MKSVFHIALIAPNGYYNKGIMDGFLAAGFTDYRALDFQLERFSIGKDLMQRKLIHEAEKMKPDLIFAQVQGSDIIDLETWQALSKIAFTVNFTFDIRINEQTQWLYNLVPHLGLVCFSNQEDVDECSRRGYKNCMVLHSSADSDVYKPSEGVERKGVVFIGNNFCNTNMEFPLSKERVKMVEFLQKEFPYDFKVYGNNWNGSKLIGQKEEVEIYQSAGIVINQNNFNNTSYTSDRIWRAVMCGAICLTKYFPGIEKMFIRHLHLDWWDTLDELKQKISYYLSHTEEANFVGSEGMKRVRENHTWSSRIKEMIVFIENLQPGVTDERNACIRAGGHVINGVIPGLNGDDDAKYKDVPCDCGKLRGDWYLCDCGNKQYQFRWKENI